MKRTVAIFVLMVWLVNCTPTLLTRKYHQYERGAEIIISERVGDNVDAEERLHYGLFKGMEGFESASFYSIRDGGYEAEIKTTKGIFLTVNRDSLAVTILRDYINTYEMDVSWLKAFEKKWAIVAYDDLGFPITSYEVNSDKNKSLPCMFGAGCGLLGALPSIFLGMLMGGLTPSGGDLDRPTEAMIIIISGTAASIVIGNVIGNKISNHRALNAIKEARNLRAFE